MACAGKVLRYQPPKTLPKDDIGVFQQLFFKPQVPVVLPRRHFLDLPAVSKWFTTPSSHSTARLNYDYLAQYGDCSVPLELTVRAQDGSSNFKRSHAPLSLFLEWTRSVESSPASGNSTSLYLAQCQLLDLSPPLREDFPTPSYVTHAGKGDIYDTNIWMGVAPTYTPLHRDPNPNLFVQLAGSKRVRLLAPDVGSEVFKQVKAKLGEDGKTHNAMFRGDEMMQGRENELLHEEIWSGSAAETEQATNGDGNAFDVSLEAGDGLFIPIGWWHSIKGVGQGVTASVSWDL